MIRCRSRECEEIISYLKSKMHIPENLKSITIKMKKNSRVKIKCEYIPEGKTEKIK